MFLNRWYHVLDENEPTLLETGSGTRVLGQVLSVEAVRPEDAGTYRCSANNDAGQTSADTRLDVVVPLRVQVRNIATLYRLFSNRYPDQGTERKN